MQRALGHRGPDGEGWFQDRRIALAHRRLSIIDLVGGAQPLTGESAGTVAIVNGEIYNYVELRRELAAAGANLRTRSDSEVVPFLYERHGEDFVHRLRGAFAAAIWDASRQQLLLVRDRLGEKPLLYATGDDGTVYFASEIGALVASGAIPVEPDFQAINRYFHFRFVPEPATPLRHVRKLPAGHVIALSPENPLPVPRQYWNVSTIAPLEGDPVAILRADLEDIGRIIVRSDVPVGVALSGGLMLLGVMLHLAESHNHEHEHEAIEHEHAHRHDDGHHLHTHDPMPAGEHSHWHAHGATCHAHAHVPDVHHGHRH